VVLVNCLPPEIAARMINFAEGAVAQIRDFLGPISWGAHHGKQVILIFAERDDYYQYVSYYYSEGTHPTSAGVHLHGGYPHVALWYDNELRAVQTIAHELTHHCLGHLPIPLWLNEGVAQMLPKVVSQPYVPAAHHGSSQAYWGLVSGWSPPVVWAEIAERHHQFWTEERIQGFWAGTSFQEAGESVELSYNLAEIMMHFLTKNREDFLNFLNRADRADGGQTAALDSLGICLGETVGTFLGPGDWRPKRKAIKNCWEVWKEKHKSSHDREN